MPFLLIGSIYPSIPKQLPSSSLASINRWMGRMIRFLQSLTRWKHFIHQPLRPHLPVITIWRKLFNRWPNDLSMTCNRLIWPMILLILHLLRRCHRLPSSPLFIIHRPLRVQPPESTVFERWMNFDSAFFMILYWHMHSETVFLVRLIQQSVRSAYVFSLSCFSFFKSYIYINIPTGTQSWAQRMTVVGNPRGQFSPQVLKTLTAALGSEVQVLWLKSWWMRMSDNWREVD